MTTGNTRVLASSYSPARGPGPARDLGVFLLLTERVPMGVVVRVAPDTPYEERIKVWRCVGTGPFIAHLGEPGRPARLTGCHPVGTPVVVLDD